jgi:uncharacterized protein
MRLMTEEASGVYAGSVIHSRIRPRQHRLSYRIFIFLLDLEEIDSLVRRLKLFSRNRFNLFSFHDRDHGAGTKEPLRAQVEGYLRAAGLDPDGGAIRLLAMPRILGYVFNPLSIYFCYRRDGALSALLYEVNNTFGERHSYFIPVTNGADATIRQRCLKRFHVSPFLDMGMTYAFRVVPPGKRVAIGICGSNAEGPVITAALAAERSALTDAALARAFIGYPLMTLKIPAGIHWEALRIWLKGIRLRERPPPPRHPVTVVCPGVPRTGDQ